LTVAFGINSAGDIGGTYAVGGVFHGFVRSSDWSFVTVNFPGAVWTIASDPNDVGDVTGAYVDAAGVEHGYFMLKRDGVFTGFEVPGAVGTEGHTINDRGHVVGPYCPSTLSVTGATAWLSAVEGRDVCRY
jgi:hypothetical protein